MARDYDFRVIAIELIDPPLVAMRETMDDRKLAELAADIRENGLRQPIGVRPVADRFRVSYGHRRRVACELAGEPLIPCLVLADDDDVEEAGKIAENWLREETNPAEEATYFARLLEQKYRGAIEPMCRALGVTEARINSRLALLLGHEFVLDALRAKRINLAVARELNKVKNEGYARLYLSQAIEFGATAAVVARWRIAREQMDKAAELEASGQIVTAPAESLTPAQSVDHCILCALASDPLEMEYVRVHRSCLTSWLRQQRAQLEAQA